VKSICPTRTSAPGGRVTCQLLARPSHEPALGRFSYNGRGEVNPMKLLALAVLFVAFGFGQSNDCDSVDKCQEVLKTDWHGSLPHFRIAEIYFLQGNT